jgi:hypothetical protein
MISPPARWLHMSRGFYVALPKWVERSDEEEKNKTIKKITVFFTKCSESFTATRSRIRGIIPAVVAERRD